MTDDYIKKLVAEGKLPKITDRTVLARVAEMIQGSLRDEPYHRAVDRETILAEVKRCAAENGGVAPGITRFETLTGITASTWRGKYWVTWGQLLQEAGFEPGTWNAAYEDEYLLGHLAALTRKVGHLPTAAEIRFEKQSNPEFPSHNTFGRFGTKVERAQRLIEYCSSREELSDVVDLMRAHIPATPVEPDAPAPKTGFVYLMKSGRFYKIGLSNDVGRRVYELGIQLPEKLVEVHRIETDDPQGIERYWHQRFADKRLNGEWFQLDKADVAALKQRRRFM